MLHFSQHVAISCSFTNIHQNSPHTFGRPVSGVPHLGHMTLSNVPKVVQDDLLDVHHLGERQAQGSRKKKGNPWFLPRKMFVLPCFHEDRGKCMFASPGWKPHRPNDGFVREHFVGGTTSYTVDHDSNHFCDLLCTEIFWIEAFIVPNVPNRSVIMSCCLALNSGIAARPNPPTIKLQPNARNPLQNLWIFRCYLSLWPCTYMHLPYCLYNLVLLQTVQHSTHLPQFPIRKSSKPI